MNNNTREQLVKKFKGVTEGIVGVLNKSTIRSRNATPGHANAFKGLNKKFKGDNWTHKFISENEIRFYPKDPNWDYSNEIYITFTDIQANDVKDLEVDKPVLKNSVAEDAITDVINNDSDAAIEWEYAYTKEEEIRVDQSAGVNLEINFQQEIFYGSGGEGAEVSGVGGKTTIGAKIGAFYNKTWGETSTVTKEHILTLSIPPKTAMHITQQRSVASFNQVSRITGVMGYGIEIHNRGNFYMKFKSLNDLYDAMGGFLPPQADMETNFVMDHWKNAPEMMELREKLLDIPDVEATVVHEISFDKASSGTINASGSPLK